MTQFTAFSGDFARRQITMFGDFTTDASPFAYNTSTALGTATQSNDTSGGLGIAVLGVSTGTSAGVFPYSGIYMAPAVSAGSAVDTTYRLGSGPIEVSARAKISASSVASHVVSVGISSCNRDTNVRPGLDFVGFFCLGNALVWSIAVINNGNVVSFPTTSTVDTFKVLRVVVDAKASISEFYIDGLLVRKIETPIRTSVGMVPCAEIKDCVSGGSNANGSLSVDYFMVQQQVNR